MNTDVQEVWTEALRSGQFCQGKCHLRIYDPKTEKYEYCCLGLLCELSGLGQWEVDENKDDGRIVYSYLNETQYLPVEVANWAGVDYHQVGDNDDSVAIDQGYFVELNDESGYDFRDIADAVTDRYRS